MGSELGFGQRFTDHMVVAHYRDTARWSELEVVPFGDLTLSPAATVFHYGQAIFEGLKAFRQPDGTVALFRPDQNAVRFNSSARRLAMPELPAHVFTAACEDLVRADHGWVPSQPDQSLYLRPMMVATEPALGVRAAAEYLFAVIASPVGAYFSSGARPLTVSVTRDSVRAAPGGTGAAKCGGNYAASLVARQDAAAHGCDEVLWLDAVEHRYVEELSGMNVAFVADGPGGPTVIAPPVRDTILDGVIRKSILELAAALGYETVERPVAVDEVTRPGAFEEAFACGTAAVIAPIGAVRSTAGTSTIGNGQPGPVTTRLRRELVAVQEGRVPDPFGWRWPVLELSRA